MATKNKTNWKYILVNHKTVPETDLFKWADWFENIANRRVKGDKVGNFWVSTIFLALDHNFGGQGRPILFETMVFSNRMSAQYYTSKGKKQKMDYHKSYNDYTRRYCTWDEAMAGHNKIVRKIKNKL